MPINLSFLLILYLLIGLSLNIPTLPVHTLPLHGNATMGYYFARIFIGNPPQQQSVIIDTGSGQLAVPCSKCTQCSRKHINPPYDLALSHTFKYITCDSSVKQCFSCLKKDASQPCKFEISYAQGSSLSGIIIEDDIRFQMIGQDEEIRTAFGCTTRETNLFLSQQANGIFGLAPQRNSNLLQLLSQTHANTGQSLSFSLCLATDGGIMHIGKTDPSLHDQSIKPVTTRYSTARNLYSLEGVGRIMMGDTTIHQTGHSFGIFGIFVDSGSTFTYFPHYQFTLVKQALDKACQLSKICQKSKGETARCYKLSPPAQDTLSIQELLRMTVLKIFPSIDIEVNGGLINWRADKYFLLREVKNGEVCIGIDGFDRYLLGANWMVDVDTFVDLKSRTITFYQNSKCSSSPRRLATYIPPSQPITEFFNSFNVSQTLITFFVFIGIIALLLIVLVVIGRKTKQQTTNGSSNNQESERLRQISKRQRNGVMLEMTQESDSSRNPSQFAIGQSADRIQQMDV